MTRAARRARARRLSATYRARQAARDLAAVNTFVPRHIAQALAATAARFQTTQAVALEAALSEALPHVRPSTIQRIAAQRRQTAERLKEA